MPKDLSQNVCGSFSHQNLLNLKKRPYDKKERERGGRKDKKSSYLDN
jgi:hypothetical protein